MAEVLTAAEIARLVAPFLEASTQSEIERSASSGSSEAVLPADLFPQLSAYLDLLLRWNARTNLTAIRDPEEIVQRHFGESLFAGCMLSGLLASGASLLDVGSGGGFPGLPIQLLRPDLKVTLAESQGKKASFLREVVRTLSLKTEVFAARVETMPATRRFDAVTLRAVDNMAAAIQFGGDRVASGGLLAVLGQGNGDPAPTRRLAIPGRASSILEIYQR